MTPQQALEAALANALGSVPEPDLRAGRVLRSLNAFRFTVSPTPGEISVAEALDRALSTDAGQPHAFWGSKVQEFARDIRHGDAEHRKWLQEAADAFCGGRGIPPARNANGLISAPADPIRNIPHWNKVGPGVPLGPWLETMHQDEYGAAVAELPEHGINLCHARILVAGDEIEWIDSHGYSTLVNPGSFKAPTHWRWQNGSGGT